MTLGNGAPALLRAAFKTECTGCARELPHGFHPFCPACGAMSDIGYELSTVTLRDSPNPYRRFLDLLPVRDPRLLPEARFTPTVHARRLGAELGLPWLYLKDETHLPTGSTKDRMAAVALAYLYESGVRGFATSSTGNSSRAYAHAIARLPGLRMYLFTAAAFRSRLALPTSDQVVDVVLEDATFVEAFAVAGQFAQHHGLVSERGFFNPGRREGLKLAWLEAAEQVPRPIDWYVQAISSAMGVYGVFKAARELEQLGLAERVPRLLCVQQESCAPMVSAWRDGAEQIRPSDIVERPEGIAAAILRGDPSRTYPHVRRIVRESNGTFVAVSERDIREARQLAERFEGISPCFAAAAALAGLVKLSRQGEVPLDDTFLVNLTGSDRVGTRPGPSTYWLARTGSGWDVGSLPLGEGMLDGELARSSPDH
jgi:threonine synthase